MGAEVRLGVGRPGLQVGPGLRRRVPEGVASDDLGTGEREEVRPSVELAAVDAQEVGAHGDSHGDYDGKVVPFSSFVLPLAVWVFASVERFWAHLHEECCSRKHLFTNLAAQTRELAK